jgi:hypothetical protein
MLIMANIRSQKHDGRGRGWSLATEVDPRRIVRASFFIILFWLLSAGSPKAVPVSQENVEYPVKLAFLYNFTKFIEWPPESYSAPGAPMVICIVGDDPFDPGLEAELRARTAGSHSVQIRTLKPNDTLSVCHIAFVPATEESQATRVLRGLKGSSTLTVGETEEFTRLGGIIDLTVEEHKVHFELNPLAAERARLKISSKLLALAKIVHDGAPPAGE